VKGAALHAARCSPQPALQQGCFMCCKRQHLDRVKLRLSCWFACDIVRAHPSSACFPVPMCAFPLSLCSPRTSRVSYAPRCPQACEPTAQRAERTTAWSQAPRRRTERMLGRARRRRARCITRRARPSACRPSGPARSAGEKREHRPDGRTHRRASSTPRTTPPAKQPTPTRPVAPTWHPPPSFSQPM